MSTLEITPLSIAERLQQAYDNTRALDPNAPRRDRREVLEHVDDDEGNYLAIARRKEYTRVGRQIMRSSSVQTNYDIVSREGDQERNMYFVCEDNGEFRFDGSIRDSSGIYLPIGYEILDKDVRKRKVLEEISRICEILEGLDDTATVHVTRLP